MGDPYVVRGLVRSQKPSSDFIIMFDRRRQGVAPNDVRPMHGPYGGYDPC